jgi:hypothetical protein
MTNMPSLESDLAVPVLPPRPALPCPAQTTVGADFRLGSLGMRRAVRNPLVDRRLFHRRNRRCLNRRRRDGDRAEGRGLHRRSAGHR